MSLQSVVSSATFAGTATTNLTSYAGEQAATFAKVTGITGNQILSNVNSSFVSSVATASTYYTSGVPRTNEYDVDCDFVNKTNITGNNYAGVWGRLLTSARTGYFVQYEVTAQGWALYVCAAGVFTQLGSLFSQVLSNGQIVHCLLQIRSGAIAVILDGVSRLTSSDNTQTGIGRGGVDGYATTTAPTNTTGLHLANLVVSEKYTHGLPLLGAG